MVQREEEDREGAGRLDVDVDEPAVLEVADELAALAERERVSPEEPPVRERCVSSAGARREAGQDALDVDDGEDHQREEQHLQRVLPPQEARVE